MIGAREPATITPEGRRRQRRRQIFEWSSADLTVKTGQLQQLLATDRQAVSGEAARVKLQPVKSSSTSERA